MNGETIANGRVHSMLKPVWNEESVWYFAYGSNMRAATMTNRGIFPEKAHVVEVRDHFLTFDIFGIPFSEPAYASIEAFPVKDPDSVQLFWKSKPVSGIPSVCGVAYLVSRNDFHRLLVTEGGGVVYEVIQLEATVLDSSSSSKGADIITAYGLKAKRPMRPNGCPSLRYMSIFLEGAEAMNLPSAYVEYLTSIPYYTKQSSLGSGMFTYFWRPLIKKIVPLTAWRVDVEGNCPRWVGSLIVFLYEWMWAYHDYIHCYVFERGDGGKLEFRSAVGKSGEERGR